MSNIKETIRQEIDTRRQHMVEELMGHEENCEYHRIKGMHDAYVDLLTFLDYSLPEEKPSEDLEKAARLYAIPHYMRDVDVNYLEEYPYDKIAEAAFTAGAEWQKEQMMKEAVEGVVMNFSSNAPRPQIDVLVDPHKYCSRDKVKIIIIKDND